MKTANIRSVHEFSLNGINYVAAPANDTTIMGAGCGGCAFEHDRCLTNGVPPCDAVTRDDDQEIIWTIKTIKQLKQAIDNLEVKL